MTGVQTCALPILHPSAAIALHFVHARKNLGNINTLHAGNTKAKSPQSDLKQPDSKQWPAVHARKPIKLVAQTAQTGHERLMAAISNKAKGGTVVNEGNNVEKAQVILRYLREHQLIEF